MESVMVVAAAASEATELGQLVALIVTPLVFWAGVTVKNRLKQMQGTNPSPTGTGKALSGAKPQATAIGGTTSGTTSEGGSGSSRELDVFVGQHVGRRKTMEIVREAHRRYGVSKRTVLRAVNRAQEKAGKS